MFESRRGQPENQGVILSLLFQTLLWPRSVSRRQDAGRFLAFLVDRYLLDCRCRDFAVMHYRRSRVSHGMKSKVLNPGLFTKRFMNVIAEISNYRVQVSQYIEKGEMSKGGVNPMKLNPATFRKMFYRLAKEACLPQDSGHPHILRHPYCIELLRAGVPVTVVRDLVGHASLNTTAIYLRLSGNEAKQILKDRGLI